METKPTKIKGHFCQHCNHIFKLKFNFDRHISFCEFSHKSVKEREFDIDAADEKIPSYNEIFKFVKELSLRITKLEKDNTKLKSALNREKRKIDVLDYLNNSNIVPTMSFSNWISSLDIRSKLETVFYDDLSSGIFQLFEDGVNNISIHCNENLPLRAFSTKNNTFYVYDNVSSDKEEPIYKWLQFSDKSFNEYLKYLSKCFIREFKIWCDENKRFIDDLNNEHFQKKYLSYFEKILGGKMDENTRFHRIKSAIYNKIKQNMKNVEYEFVE
jgi:hypothetical protein